MYFRESSKYNECNATLEDIGHNQAYGIFKNDPQPPTPPL